MARGLWASLVAFVRSYPEVLLSAASLVFLSVYFRRSRRSSVVFPVNWPVVGMLPDLIANIDNLHDWATDILRESGCTFLFHGPWFTGMDRLVTADPANVNHVFNVNFPNYPKGDEFSEIFDVLGNGIFNADGESWKSQRHKAHTLISDRRFRSFTAEASRVKVEKGLLPLLTRIAEHDQVVDLQDVLLRLTFDLTCNLVFGVDPGCLAADFPTVPFARALDDAMEVLLYRHVLPMPCWKLLRWLGLGEERKLARAWKVMDHFVAETTSKRREDYNKDDLSAPKVDLLTSYVETSRLNPIEFDHKFLRDTTVNLMLAGRDTTGAALSWFFWLITENPHVEKRLLEELKVCTSLSTCKDGFFVFDTKEVGKLVYLHAALCEALRLFPPIPFETKAVSRPDVLPSGAQVGTSTMIHFWLYGMARMEGIWGKDCMDFNPERWITEHGKLRHEPSYKFMSFNSGPRTCLGRGIAFTQMKTVAAAMVYNFRVDVVEGHVVEPKISIILHMKNGLNVRIRKRVSG